MHQKFDIGPEGEAPIVYVRPIAVKDLPEELLGKQFKPVSSFPSLQEIIHRHLQDALKLSGGVRCKAARMLAIDRKRLRRMMCRYQIT